MLATPPKRRLGCTGSKRSRQFWWIVTNILRLRRGQAHYAGLKRDPTLTDLKRENSELKQMLMLNEILQDLVLKKGRPTRANTSEWNLKDKDILTIALQHNQIKSPFKH